MNVLFHAATVLKSFNSQKHKVCYLWVKEKKLCLHASENWRRKHKEPNLTNHKVHFYLSENAESERQWNITLKKKAFMLHWVGEVGKKLNATKCNRLRINHDVHEVMWPTPVHWSFFSSEETINSGTWRHQICVEVWEDCSVLQIDKWNKHKCDILWFPHCFSVVLSLVV